ncbi:MULTISPECIES: ABC-three component system middle component 2 [Bacillales]|uniref:ABC-three component system middle component 2 n=1 Tax=Bacillales TaxID=1385 RepID=UPI002896D440|nr:ABC-three component system middle component 2 [Rummeliibacillus suwonensis]
MYNKIFNTEFEMSLRLLLVLSLSKNKNRTLDDLVTADFISNYSKEIGLSDSNLHGDNEFSFSEFSARRLLAQGAIKNLVLENMIKVSYSKDGFQYFISNRGQTLCSSLTSDYATEYRIYAKKALTYMDSKNDKELLNLFGQAASKSLWRE